MGLETVAGLLAVYITAYLLLGSHGLLSGKSVRFFQSQWQADLFAPAARVESIWAGHQVETACLSGCGLPSAASEQAPLAPT